MNLLYLSPRLKIQLQSISDNRVAEDLLDKQGTFLKTNITFVDLNEQDDNYLTFIPIEHAQKLINQYHPKADDTDVTSFYNEKTNEALWRNRDNKHVAPVYKSKNFIKIGKFANKILGGKYSSADLEEFVNLFKSSSTFKRETFDVVKGKDIEHWYDLNNYIYKQGSLGSSCMADKKDFFDIYTNNPKSCKLVILKLDDKIVARALLWKIDKISSPDEKVKGKIEAQWFLDRVYSIEDYQIEKVRKWAIDKNYAIKSNNSSVSWYSVFYKNSSYKDTKIKIKVKPIEYDKYPYLDTFFRYDSKKGLLYNDFRFDLGGHTLRSTSGGFTPSISRKKIIINKFKSFFK